MDEDLLYKDLFQDKYILDSIGRGSYYEEYYPKLIKERNRKSTQYIKHVLNVLQSLRQPPKEKGNVLFLEHKFIRIAKELSKYYNIFLLHDSIRIFRDFVKDGYIQHFYRTWMRLVDKSYTTANMRFANKAKQGVQNYLIKNKIKIVIIGNDKMFMERLVLRSAQTLGIPVVVIQHGIYTDEISFKMLKTANTADIFWTWSQFIKDCYLKRYNKNPDSVKVIGYPFELLDNKPKGDEGVLFLGNNYKNGDSEEADKFLERARVVLKICNEEGIPFHYRPHPGEIFGDEYGDIIEHITSGKSLLEDIDSSNIVIGDVSSVMVEAALCKRHVIQLIWNDLSRKAANDPMYSFTIKVNDNRADIRQAILQCMKSTEEQKIDEYYIYRNPHFFDDVRMYVDEYISHSN